MTYNVFVNSDVPKATGHNVRIGSLLARTAESRDRPIVANTVRTQAERSDDSASVYEEVDAIGHTFARFNMTGGEGLAWYPPRSGKIVPELDPIRYFDSANLRVGRENDEEPFRIELTKNWTPWAVTGSVLTDIFVNDEGMWGGIGTTLYHWSDLEDSTPVQYTASGTIACIFGSQSGDVLIITTSGNLDVRPRGATALDTLAYQAGVNGTALTFGWWAKGRGIVQRGKTGTLKTVELVELGMAVSGTAGAPVVAITVVVVDTFDADVQDVIDGSVAIVAALTNGELRSYVPQSDSAGSAPVLTLRGTTPLPSEERPVLLGFNAGKLIVQTDHSVGSTHIRRTYSSEILDARFDFVIGQFQLLKEHEASTVMVPSQKESMVSTRSDIWWAYLATSGDFELWRYDVTTTGVFREAVIPHTTPTSIHNLVMFDSHFGVCISGVYRHELDTYVAQGYLITPNINFGRSGELAWLNAEVIAESIGSSSGVVTMYYSVVPDAIYDSNHPSWVALTTISSAGQSGSQLLMDRVESQQLAIKLEIRRLGAGTNTPRLLRFSVRAVSSNRDWQVIVPVDVSDVITAPFRQSYRLPGWGEAVYQALMNLEGANIELEIFEPYGKFTGVVDAISAPVEYRTDRGSVTTYTMLELRGKRISGSEQFAGSNAWTLVPWAQSLWATGETENDLV